ncbi:PadR family transcriptional regulator [Sphingoaurantiacus capsulatus]|uniref:PadR family transcriptional regulator n=1 Tax=Sphingoaurantiacus capsulatus TaxID=1771310 RepID=A0ABV7X679_9SPHN
MTRSRALSDIARTVLAALASAGSGWVHGYDLCRQAGVKSGTLYPLLIRLEAQGHLAAEWQPPSEPGRPPRHAYRLTKSGRQLAMDNPPAAAAAPLAGKLA